MRRLMLLVGAVAVVVAGAALRLMVGASRAADAVSCPAITDLSKLPGWSASRAVAINNSGQIIGYRTTTNYKTHAFLWQDGKMAVLGTLGGTWSQAAAINERGQIVGYGETKNYKTHAFLWQDGKMTDLGTLRGGRESDAVAINERGQIVGWSTIASNKRHGFLWQDGKMTDLGTLPGGTESQAFAINERGQIVGSSDTKGGGRAFLWQNGKMTYLGSKSWEPAAINERGQIVGYGTTRNYRTRAFLWQDGKMTDLGTFPGGGTSRATAINEHGQIVGYSTTKSGEFHAVLWQDGKMTDLGTLSRDLYSYGVAINDSGQMIGWSSSSSVGTAHAVLWTLRPTSGSRCPVSKPWQSGDSVVVHENSITVVGSGIAGMKADAGRAAMLVDRGGSCADIFVWNPSRRKIVTVVDHRRCSGMDPLGSFGGVALAGDNAAWAETGGGNILESYVFVMSLATGHSTQVAAEFAGSQGSYGRIVADPEGDGGLLVYNDYERCWDVSPPDVPCPPGVEDGAIVSDQIHLALPSRRVIATSDHELTVLAVGAGRVVALQHAGPVIVLAPKRVSTGLVRYNGFSAERLIATYKYKPDEVLSAATDGRTLAVLRKGALDVIPLPGSHGTPTRRTLPITAERLTDLDGNIAVYIRGNAVYLLNLTTGSSIIFAKPKVGPVNAQLEPDGLYLAARNTLTFTPRAKVEQRLHR